MKKKYSIKILIWAITIFLFSTSITSLKAQYYVSTLPGYTFYYWGPAPASYKSIETGFNRYMYKAGNYWYLSWNGGGFAGGVTHRSPATCSLTPLCNALWEKNTPGTSLYVYNPWMSPSGVESITITTGSSYHCSTGTLGTRAYVDLNATGANDGSSWTDAFTSLESALDAARSCGVNEIWVAKGTYKPSALPKNITGSPTLTSRDYTFHLVDGVKMYGGFIGNGVGGNEILLSQRVTGNETILSGDLNGDDVLFTNNSENCFHVVTTINDNSNTTLDNFTIIGGNATGDGTSILVEGWHLKNNFGGGIYSAYSYTLLENDLIKLNKASYAGGIYTRISTNTIKNSFVNSNTADIFGGGLYNENSVNFITNVSFGQNKANRGGGSYIFGAHAPNIKDCLYLDNNAHQFGGGIFNDFSNPSISNTVFDKNHTYFFYDPTGGGSVNNGGAIYNNTSHPTINNSVFYKNNSERGSAIYNNFSNPVITNSTLFENVSSTYGSIYNTSSTPTISNSIFWGNTGLIEPPLGSIITYSDVQGGYAGIGNIGTNPNFTNPTNPKGLDGIWRTADDGLRLQSTSPAINASDPATTSPTTDISNYTRSGVFDLGAYEFVNPCPFVFTANRAYVNYAATGANNGTTWADAFTDFQSALEASRNCGVTEIWVAKGTYMPSKDLSGNTTGPLNYYKTFLINNDVKIYGGFIGSEPLRHLRNPELNPTILSGDLGVSGTLTDNSFTVLYIINTTMAGVLDGFTIYRGNSFLSGTSAYNGAGIHVKDGNSIINDCKFIRNNAYGGGGAIMLWANASTCSPKITNCKFFNNIAHSFGNPLSNPEVIGTGGGAIKLYGQTSTSICAPLIENCFFYSNSGMIGGAINSTGFNANPTIINSVFTQNSSFYEGHGGAISNKENISNIINCTFYNNNATGANAIYNSNATTNITNCILWGSNDEIQNHSSTLSHFTTVSHSNIQGGYAGTSNINIAPNFLNSILLSGADGIYSTADDGLSLNNCSPVINAGNNSAVITIPTDISGALRIQTGTVDMGAYENSGAGCGFVISVTTGDWETGSTWNIGRPPIQSEMAIIDVSHMVSINTATAKAKDVELRLNSNIKYANTIANLRLGN